MPLSRKCMIVVMMIFSFVFVAQGTSKLALCQDAADQPSSSGRVFQDKDSPIAFGIQTSIESKILKESREINIYLPPSYQTKTEAKYPVIYLLDGGIDEDYHHQTGLVQFMVMYQLMPESILIGIGNTDRQRDMTHATIDEEEKKEIPTCGGSANFLKFIATELKPFVESKYRTGDQNTIIGQSLGALLVTEALVERPELFDNYVIVSPSLYWSRKQLVNRFANFLKTNQGLQKKIFLAIGKEHPLMHETMDQLVGDLRAHAPDGIKWKYNPLPKETHATVMHRATYQAYEFLYGDQFKGL